VTAVGGAVFVSSERGGDASGTSRTSVLRYDVCGTGVTLTATEEWNLTAGLRGATHVVRGAPARVRRSRASL
jgi:hypothetical protein